MKEINIFGAGGHSLVIESIVKKLNYDAINIFDDNLVNSKINNFRGNFDDLVQYNKDYECDNFIAIGDNLIRKEKFLILSSINMNVISIIDPSANVSKDVLIGVGSVIMPGCNINSKSIIGKCAIINTGSNIDHEAKIGDFVHISPGCNLSGQVQVGRYTWIGIGSTIINNIKIGDNVFISAGSTIYENIHDNKRIYEKKQKLIKSSKLNE